jgi:hypothetical protein
MTEHPEDPRVTQADRDVVRAAVTGEGLIPITSVEQLRELAAAAAAVKAAFDGDFAGLTREQADFVRDLRVGRRYTWRAVAETCAVEWSGDWGSNQLAGMALCERAARLLGEDPDVDPWN